MPSTHKLIASYTVGATAVNYITFSSIPQTYSDLIIVVGGSNTANNYGGFFLRFNNTDYSSTMTGRRIRLSGSTAVTDNSKEAPWPLTQAGNLSAKSFAEYYIPNYSTSGTPKNANFFGGSPDQAPVMYNNVWWSGTDAISTIDIGIFDSASDKFTTNSSAYLYGISNA